MASLLPCCVGNAGGFYFCSCFLCDSLCVPVHKGNPHKLLQNSVLKVKLPYKDTLGTEHWTTLGLDLVKPLFANVVSLPNIPASFFGKLMTSVQSNKTILDPRFDLVRLLATRLMGKGFFTVLLLMASPHSLLVSPGGNNGQRLNPETDGMVEPP